MKLLKTLGTALLITGICSCTAFAATAKRTEIKSLTISIDPGNNIAPGEMVAGIEPTVNGNNVAITHWSDESGNHSIGQLYYYTIELEVTDPEKYKFGDMSVSVKGASSVDIISIDSSRMKIKAKTYPFYRLANPEGFEGGEDVWEWDKVKYANKYKVTCYYENDDGNSKSLKKTVSKPEFDLSEYADDYDPDTVEVSVQAVNDSKDKGKFYASSQAIFAETGNEDTAVKMENFSLPTAQATRKKSGASVNTDVSRSAKSSYYEPVNTNGPSTGWTGGGDVWYYLDAKGKNVTGWYQVSNLWYYFDPNVGNTYGQMVAGWREINGLWYCFETRHNGYYGAMLANCTTPDGYYVNQDGVWVQ